MDIGHNEAARRVGMMPQSLTVAINKKRIRNLSEYETFEDFERDVRANILSRGEEAASRIETDGFTLNELRMKNEIAKLAMLNMDVEERKGKLVYRDAVDRVVASIFAQYKEGLAGLPARVAPVMAAKLGVDQHELMVELEDMIRDYLGRLPDEIRLDFSRRPIGRPRKGAVG